MAAMKSWKKLAIDNPGVDLMISSVLVMSNSSSWVERATFIADELEEV
jgi:hypothetical protein